ncbi:uncharacterized protein LOC134876282 [Eleginops maclovinus]|uniref:uncharacterized protein LOC134876282 n=1 Tax=Eleginops maclovinus TaxID=56733 RepID=UPI00307FF8B1
MSDCAEFLLEETPPNIPGILQDGRILDQNRYKVICQTFKNRRRFVTLYDTSNRIPVFSAYKYTGEEKSVGKQKPRPPWMMEPELQPNENSINMRNDENQNQASNYDYCVDQNNYNRGHLFPRSYGFDESDRNSTFTLTNIVPQSKSFNGGSWAKMESCVKCILNQHCIDKAFVVTGAKPGNNQLNQRVNIPSLLWSAYCCYSYTLDKWLAAAHWGDNVRDVTKLKTLQTKTLAELHDQLGYEVFPGTECPRYQTGLEEEKSKTIHQRSISTLHTFCQCLPEPSTTSAPPTTSTTFASTTIAPTWSSTLPTTTEKATTVLTTTIATTMTTTTTTTTTKKKEDNPDNNKGDEGGGGGGGGGLGGGGGGGGGGGFDINPNYSSNFRTPN